MPEYPHRVTIALTDKAYKELERDMGLRHMMGDISPVSMSDLISLYILNSIQNNDSSFPVFLRGIKEIKEETDKRIRTIVPCKECHEHPCTCKPKGTK